jgi:phage FluMu gp28-like protein
VSAEIREDLQGIHQRVSYNGQISYRSPATADGHSDRAVALALALRAAESAPVACIPTVIMPKRGFYIDRPAYVSRRSVML